MNCEQAKTAISALLDNEDPGIEPEALVRHVARCQLCRAYTDRASELHRSLRLQSAPPVPDLTASILQSLVPAERDERLLAIRICLVVIAIAQLVAAAPALLLGDEAGSSTHAARHAGAFAVALAIGFLVAAVRPHQVAGVLVITTVVVICLAGAGFADTAAGRTDAIAEIGHAPELLGVGALWVLCRSQPRLRLRASS